MSAILQLFFITRGSVVLKIAGQIVGVAVFSLLVQLVDSFLVAMPSVSIAAMGIFGIVVSYLVEKPSMSPVSQRGECVCHGVQKQGFLCTG